MKSQVTKKNYKVHLGSDLTRKGKLVNRQPIKPRNVIKHSSVIQWERGQFRKLSVVSFLILKSSK